MDSQTIRVRSDDIMDVIYLWPPPTPQRQTTEAQSRCLSNSVSFQAAAPYRRLFASSGTYSVRTSPFVRNSRTAALMPGPGAQQSIPLPAPPH